MIKHYRSKASLKPLCLSWLLSMPLMAQNTTNALEGLDQALLDEPSDWLQVEVAVVIDTTESALFSEQWPLIPEPSYPQRARWLTDPAADQELLAQYPGSEFTKTELGKQTLWLPTPERLFAQANAELAAAMDKYLDDLNAGTLPVMPDLPLPIASDVASTPNTSAEGASAVPLEALRGPIRPVDDLPPLALDELRAGVLALEALPPRVTPSSTAEPQTDSDTLPDDAPGANIPPALPTPFLKQEGSLLAQGLKRLSRNTGDQVRMYTAWLQPADATNLPIVLTDSVDDSDWPALQGFIQLVKRDGWRMGINIWLNTAGDYLPDGLTLPAPPAQPNRTVFVSEDSQNILTGPELLQRQQWLRAFHQTQLLGDFPPAPDTVEPDSDAAIAPGDDPSKPTVLQQNPTGDESVWPYRHVIHVADTRSLAEGHVRYFDHPVIKIVATYTELSWRQVYALGDQEKAMTDSPQAVDQ